MQHSEWSSYHATVCISGLCLQNFEFKPSILYGEVEDFLECFRCCTEIVVVTSMKWLLYLILTITILYKLGRDNKYRLIIWSLNIDRILGYFCIFIRNKVTRKFYENVGWCICPPKLSTLITQMFHFLLQTFEFHSNFLVVRYSSILIILMKDLHMEHL